MKKVNLKQGTLEWDIARQTRIGGSEVFDIVRYYATDQELQNCGINAEKFKAEAPYTSVWALYHKILDDGEYQREELAPEFAEYGHAVEPYGLYVLQKSRSKRLKAGEVYADDRLIASLDISGVAEEIDIRPFDRGEGTPQIGQKFVCEQKSMMPQKVKSGIPYKYLIQAQYQLIATGAKFYILQIMVLNNDTVYERGKIVQMSVKKRKEYLADKLSVSNYYIAPNLHLATLIKTCLSRFFSAVDERKEPTPFIETDPQRNIIHSIRCNSLFSNDRVIDPGIVLAYYIGIKQKADAAEQERKKALQQFVELAKDLNGCKFKDRNGNTAQFSASGAFLVKEAKE